MKRILFLIVTVICIGAQPIAAQVLFGSGKTTVIRIDENEPLVVHTAASLLQQDVRAVFDATLQITGTDGIPGDVSVVAGTIGKSKIIDQLVRKKQINVSAIKGKWETFLVTPVTDGKQRMLVISGSDGRGTAYGLLELSRMIGVSPWHYFADIRPDKQAEFVLPGSKIQQSPSVRYRGIFLNDEDWGLMPWATRTLDPVSEPGAIGPKAYEKIFELLLRLRANTIWPAMHECTIPFYFVKGNKEMADKYGIVVGTSHCEPMVRCSASEWDKAGEGDYNYVTNRDAVLSYWADRLIELKGSENLYTIGMRGKHDGKMQGVKTNEEYKLYLDKVIKDQEELIRKYVHPDPSLVPQVFIPYKEVLEVYDAGLEVPDYVTLVWCDDNHGYIRRLSDGKERKRKGGSGVYYHVSYWGSPHDYLWLASTSPALMYTEMKRAYDHGAEQLWILNVGDIKPAEYLMEFFLDLAWDIRLCDRKPVFAHLEKWAAREFGTQLAPEIASVMKSYYHLANIRKPEHTGWNRVEEGPVKALVKDAEYNPGFNQELQRRIGDYQALEKKAAGLGKKISGERYNSYYQLVEYPVTGASLINQKWLYARLSHHHTETDPDQAMKYAYLSLQSYRDIEDITKVYNEMEHGKWNRIMDMKPRNLAVFAQPRFSRLDSLVKSGYQPAPRAGKQSQGMVMAQNATEAVDLRKNGSEAIEGLGHSFNAVPLKANSSLSFVFDTPVSGEGAIWIATIPNHDVDGKGQKITVSVNGKEIQTCDYRVSGRSETWKQQVLRGQSLSIIPYTFSGEKTTITIKALTPYVILDQVMINTGKEKFYEFPVPRTGIL